MSSSNAAVVVCSRCRKEGHRAADCKTHGFLREICKTCGGLGHSAEKCPREAAARAALRKSQQKERLAAMVCHRCGEKGHGRSACRMTDEELKERRRAAYLATETCHRCGKLGHLKAECKESEADADKKSDCTEETNSTMASRTECNFCGVSLAEEVCRKGKKNTGRCQTCWRAVA